jgi:pyruvate formate lyase activating enzyme
MRGAGGAGEGGPKLTVRIPLIPDVNDDEENLEASAHFLGSLPGPPPVDVLPYHRLGVDKYERLGREYALSEVDAPSGDVMGRAVRILELGGLTVTVRGEHYGDN